MDILKNKPQLNKKPTKGKGRMPIFSKGPISVFSKIINGILIILIISTLYSLIFTGGVKNEQISIGQLATDINSGIVQKIEVKGDNLLITYSSTSSRTTKSKRRKRYYTLNFL